MAKLIDKIKGFTTRENTETCLACHGRGVKVQNIDLLEPCLYCGGVREVPFTDNVIPKMRPPDDFELCRMVERNIHTLMVCIREQYMRIGVEADVRIETRSRYRGETMRMWAEKDLLNPTLKDIYPEDGNFEEKYFVFPKKEAKCTP